MARYTPHKAVLVARDDTAVNRNPHDALSAWLSMVGSSLQETRKFDDVSRCIDEKGLTFYQVQNIGNLAAMIPHVSSDADPLDRIDMVLRDDKVKDVAQSRMKSFHRAMSHAEAVYYAEKLLPILNKVTHKGTQNAEQHVVVSALLHSEEDIMDIVDGLSFPPSLPELVSRLSQKKHDTSSLYPSVPKDKTVTRRTLEERRKRFTKPEKSDFYDVGEKVSVTMDKEFLDVDEEANDFLMQGYNLKEVVAFHNLAPEGYWEAVSQRMEDNDELDFNEVYDMLEEVFHFHPDDREPLK